MKYVYSLLVMLLLSCNATKTQNTIKSLVFHELHSGNTSPQTEEGFQLITDYKSLVSFYNTVNIEKIPEVNFKEDQVIVVFLGQQNTGGYAVSVNAIQCQENVIKVYAKKTAPKKGMLVTTMLTQPYVIVKTSKNAKPILLSISNE